MKVGIPREVLAGERRVAGTPDTVRKLVDLGFAVQVESGAGEAADQPDAAYAEAGAEVVDGAASLWATSDLVLKVRPPTLEEADLLKEGAAVVGFVFPASQGPLLERLAARSATLLAMDCVPRISRAQKMDALSSMANIAGYRAVVEASAHFGRFFTGQITAAGKVPPAKVLVIGAGVAGLASIAAAKGLGAIVRAFDTRAAVREQVQSLGAEFLEVEIEESGDGGGGYARQMSPEFIRAEMDLFHAQAKEVDIIVTTALVPGRPAPRLLERRAVEAMRPGSVIVDLAAEQGGNCELTVPGERVVHQGVQILGFTDLPSRMAATASQLYGTNLVHLLSDMGGGRDFRVDLEDEVVRGALVLHRGETTWPPPPPKPAPEAAAAPAGAVAPKPAVGAAPRGDAVNPVGHRPPDPRPVLGGNALAALGVVAAAGWLALRYGLTGDASPAATQFLQHLTVFVLACFVGWQVIWSVSPALHTPLMSVTNAISGIIIVGGMLQAHGDPLAPAAVIGGLAVLLAAINVAGGFLVTQRMLRMFRK
ncbi:Re/Si-specific NAD(P)(+) transhydrogenase subunit alpha [Myxococcota bacterium]|nr:Re/Si-specific NAD(P)(+) transhydrogenase subunit alpha [Myxococcota bacterium]